MEHFNNLNWLAVGAATVVSFVFGSVWYHPKVFGTIWADSAGVELKVGPGGLIATFLATLALAAGTAFLLRATGLAGAGAGLLLGGLATIAFVLPAILGQWVFMNRLPLFAVNIGFNLLNLMLVGGIVGWLQV